MNEFIEQLEDAMEKDEGSIGSKDEFRNYPEWDSLMVFAVMSMLSDEFDVPISRDEFEGLTTVEELYNFVLSKKQ